MTPSDFIYPEDTAALRQMESIPGFAALVKKVLAIGFNQGIVKEMAGSSHTSACSLSKLRSCLEAGKKQPRVWLQYGGSVTEMLLYTSFGAPKVLLLSPYGDSEKARYGFLDELSGKAEREDGSKWYATGNTCSSVNESFMTSCNFVQTSALLHKGS